MSTKESWMGMMRDELVPIIIVGVLLGIYAFETMAGRPVTEHLETMVTTVVAFYFGAKTFGANRG